jgi:DNA-binding protein HU-beta
MTIVRNFLTLPVLPKSLNTKDFIKALSEKLGVSQKEASQLLDDTSAVIRSTVISEGNLTIQNLGKFQLKKTESRESYIPALGKKALVPPKQSLLFSPSETLKAKLKSAGKK